MPGKPAARVARALCRLAAALGIAGSGSCRDATPPGLGASLPVPLGVVVEAIGPTGIRVSWSRVERAEVSGYEVQRRANLTGDFLRVASVRPATSSSISFFDTDLEPGAFYGYRIVALSALGGRSLPSNVGGARTAPPPTLIIDVVTEAAIDRAADPDGYVTEILGPRDTLSAPIASTGQRRFSPLRPGVYTVVLRGLAPNCDFRSGDSTRVARIVETGLDTETRVRYEVSCRDPAKGSLVVRYEQEGDTTDANGVRMSITGLLAPVPGDSTTVYARTETIQTRIATYRYDNLRAGQYEIALDDVATVCSVVGNRRRNVAIRALSLDTVRFQAVCARPFTSDTAGKPLTLEHRWSSSAVPLGAKVSLITTLDGSARPGRSFGGVQLDLSYLSSVVRFDSARKGDFGIFTSNGTNPGLVILATADPDGLVGSNVVSRTWFTVIGQTGASVRTGTTLNSVVALNPTTSYRDSVRVQEATLTVGQFSGENRPPIARANGPYTATAGVAVQLTAGGSSDPDGTIATYEWTTGDGAKKGGENVLHTYQAAGIYTARVTVTDNLGATATETAVVTVTQSGAPNQPPVARISAPSTGAPNTSITFAGTQSTDTDGTITSYAWNFGDGSTGTGATASHTYATPGTYSVALTVTDNRGAASTALHSITIAPTNPGATPFVWTAAFGAVDAGKIVELAITLDLSANIPETPGAEALQSFVVDSLKWDPAVVQLQAFNFGPGQQQAIDHSDVTRGKLSFSSQTIAAANSGMLAIARIRFRVVGAPGSRVTTQTVVGAMIGTAATGSFNYRPRVEVREATLTVP